MPSSRPSLRMLKPNDLDADNSEELFKLFNRAIMHAGTLGFIKPMSRKRAQEYFDDMARGIESGDIIAVVAGAKSSLEGFGLIRRDSEDVMRHCFEMGRIMVRPENQRHGVGGALVKRLVAEAKRRKVEILWLDVRITNTPAIELFQKLGFRTWGIFPGRIKDKRNYDDVLYMALDLRPTYRPLRDQP